MKKNRKFKRDMRKLLRDITLENSALKWQNDSLVNLNHKKSTMLMELENFMKHPTIEHKVHRENNVDIYGAVDHEFQINIPLNQPLRYIVRVDNRLYSTDERFKKVFTKVSFVNFQKKFVRVLL